MKMYGWPTRYVMLMVCLHQTLPRFGYLEVNAERSSEFKSFVTPTPVPIGRDSPWEVRCSVEENDDSFIRGYIYGPNASGPDFIRKYTHIAPVDMTVDNWGPGATPVLKQRAVQTIWTRTGRTGDVRVVVGLFYDDTLCTDHERRFKCVMTYNTTENNNLTLTYEGFAQVLVLDRPLPPDKMTISPTMTLIKEPTNITFECDGTVGMTAKPFRWFVAEIQHGNSRVIEEVTKKASQNNETENGTGCATTTSSVTIPFMNALKGKEIPPLVVVCRVDYGSFDLTVLCYDPKTQFCRKSHEFHGIYIPTTGDENENVVAAMTVVGIIILSVFATVIWVGVSAGGEDRTNPLMDVKGKPRMEEPNPELPKRDRKRKDKSMVAMDNTFLNEGHVPSMLLIPMGSDMKDSGLDGLFLFQKPGESSQSGPKGTKQVSIAHPPRTPSPSVVTMTDLMPHFPNIFPGCGTTPCAPADGDKEAHPDATNRGAKISSAKKISTARPKMKVAASESNSSNSLSESNA